MTEESGENSRRQFFATSGFATGGLALTRYSRAGEEGIKVVRPFTRYSELLKILKDRGHKPRILSSAPDRSPVVAVKAGGEKKPAILISAGSHATEQAGVRAAVELIDRLKRNTPSMCFRAAISSG